MTNPGVESQADELPFEPWTALRAITRHLRLVFLLGILAGLLGIVAAKTFVREDYASEAVLLFTPSPGDDKDGNAGQRLDTRKDMVKVLPNLQEVIRRRNLDVTPPNLGRACEANVERDSNILSIRVTWSTAELAAAIANDLADVFLETQASVRRAGLKQRVSELERQQAQAQAALRTAADALGRFRQEHEVTAVDEQIRTSIAEVSSLQSQLDQVLIEGRNLEEQRSHLTGVMDHLNKQLTSGQLGPATVSTPVDQGREVARLRQAIDEDRTSRERKTMLSAAEVALTRTQRLASLGLVPRGDVDKARMEFERAQAVATVTPQMAEWRSKAETLEKSLASPTTQNLGAAALSPEVSLRAFQIELDSLAIDQKVKYLNDALTRTRAKLASFPPLQRAMFDLQAETARCERELAALEEPLARARRAESSAAADFVLVSRAQPLPMAVTRRKLMAAAVISAGFFAVCLGFIGLKELATGQIRSGRELEFLTHLPVFTQLPAREGGRGALEELKRTETEMGLLSRLSRRLENTSSDQATRILISGPASPAERQRAVDGLLAQYLLQGRRIAWISLVETNLECRPEHRPTVTSHPTLQEYLRTDTVSSGRLLDARESDAVAVIGGSSAVAPHLRGGGRMRTLLHQAAERFDVVVLVGDSLLDEPDELPLARECDVVLLMAQAHWTSRDQVKRLASLVKDAALKRCGWLLLGVQSAFASLTAEKTW